MPISRLASPDEAIAQVSTLLESGKSALLVFFGSEDPANGESWCADCVTADPVLRRACATLRPDLTLYECPVGERSVWKNRPDHPFRNHPQIRLQRIPTLLFIEDGLERGRLVEADCAQVEVVEAFLTR